MVDRNEFVAVASSDGIIVNQHFGRAEKFYIYKLYEDDAELIEVREVTPGCNGGSHNETTLEDTAKTISDCRYVIVSKIGYGASNIIESLGIRPYEIPDYVDESIERLIKQIKINQLFKN